jgi:lysophospholipase L1-like esterase
VRFLALGNSYTVGTGVPIEDRWPVQLAGRLRQQGLPLPDVRLVAQNGWTTDELLRGIQAARLSPTFDLVSLQIGVNNQFRGYDLQTYRQEFRQLLETAIELTAGKSIRVLVLSIPDWGVTPFAVGRDRGQIALEIDRFNAVNRNETAMGRAQYVDVTPLTRVKGDQVAFLAPDDLHPSGKMYAAWVQLLLPSVLAALGSED